jgi:hypothetical protein
MLFIAKRPPIFHAKQHYLFHQNTTNYNQNRCELSVKHSYLFHASCPWSNTNQLSYFYQNTIIKAKMLINGVIVQNSFVAPYLLHNHANIILKNVIQMDHHD